MGTIELSDEMLHRFNVVKQDIFANGTVTDEMVMDNLIDIYWLWVDD